MPAWFSARPQSVHLAKATVHAVTTNPASSSAHAGEEDAQRSDHRSLLHPPRLGEGANERRSAPKVGVADPKTCSSQVAPTRRKKDKVSCARRNAS